MPRSSTWFWILLLAAAAIGGLKMQGVFRDIGGASGLLTVSSNVPNPSEEGRTFAAPVSVTHPAGAMASPELWPSVAYEAERSRDPLANLLLVKKASPPPTTSPIPAASSVASAPPAPPIQGFMLGGRQPQVIIDGNLYTVGDTVQGVTIVAIDKTGITGDFQGQSVRWTSEK